VTILTEDRRTAAHYIVSEAANIYRSREQVTIGQSAKLKAGTVLGRVMLGAAVAAAKAGGNTGDATISAVTRTAATKIGVYVVRFTAATKFDVSDPDGFKIGSGSTGAAYADDLGFTITAGSTPMVAGDGFDITVSSGSKTYVPLDAEGSDGSQLAAAILWGPVDATDGDVRGVITARDTEVVTDALIWPEEYPTESIPAQLQRLAAHGIIGR